jgi:prepilin-type N-terminal cleavage/methylation domain-containing protein
MRRARGFTLIEIAIVLVIVGLLLGGLLMPLAAQVKAQRVEETKKTMEEIKEALLGFAAVNVRLPCPDTTGDGQSDPPNAGACPNTAGNVPWATLGVSAEDTWGHRFRYQVDNGYTTAITVSPPAATFGVNSRDPTSKAQVTLAQNVPVVLVSYGANGYGARTKENTTIVNPPPQNQDEMANKGGAGGIFTTPVINFWSRPTTNPAGPTECSDTAVSPAPFCEFDDVVSWISTPVIISRLVAAGQL